MNRLRISLTPRLLHEALDAWVVGQSEVKIALAIAVYNHLIRTESLARLTSSYELGTEFGTRNYVGSKILEKDGTNKLTSLKGHDQDLTLCMRSGTQVPIVDISKSNILLLGPTGI